ncbi:MAG TPA: VCBS repeat-containing protein [Elusimicrobiota bacterium]|nr:VCBS repeat-containing protein [Elusimicrobiota bacterium]
MKPGSFLLAVAIFLSASPARCALALGYVVKVEGAKIFLDFGQSSGASVGQAFTVYAEGDSLKHPVTGEELGREEKTLASGRILEIHEKYSVGEIAPPVKDLAAGQKARLGAPPPPPAPAPAAAAPGAPAAAPSAHAPFYRSPSLKFEAVDTAIGNIDGSGATQVAIAGKNNVDVYPLRTDDQPWKASCSFKDDGTSVQFLSLEAADLDGDGRAELFATIDNLFFNRVETYVLVCKDGKLEKKATLPWMVRSYYTSDGATHLAAQQFMADGAFPLSDIHPLRFANGTWGVAPEKLHFKRVEWLYGFLVASQDGEDIPVFLTKSSTLRMQFAKDSWVSSEAYGQTSNRVRWQDKVFTFHPRFVVEPSSKGLAGLYTLRNIPRFGTFSDSFGMYNRSELHYLRFNGLSLEPAWSVEVAGYSTGLARTPSGDLLAAVVGASGRTSVWLFKP